MDVSLVLTHACNLGCTYCYTGQKFRRAMPESIALSALDLAFSDDSPKIQLSFFGGEPLLGWDLLRRATLLAKERAARAGKRLVLTLTTNGTLLRDEHVRFFVEHGFFVGFSIDGDRAAHEATRPTAGGRSSWDAAVRGLDALLDAGAWLETISVIDPANVRWLGQTVRWLADRGVARIALNPNFGGDWSDDDLSAWRAGYEEAARVYIERNRAGQPIYINVIEDKILTHVKGGYQAEDHCRMGRGSVAVAPSGNLYPCERMVGEDDDISVQIGHVRRGVDPGRLAALDGARAATREADCGDCAVQSRCMSFCACANRAETGELGRAGGVQCWHEQMLIEVADAVGNALWRARDRHFLQRVYGYEPAARGCGKEASRCAG